MDLLPFLPVAEELEQAGLVWQPEIGDEISLKQDKRSISILVDPQGMTPRELRTTYLWLPTVEQLVSQFEARQAILYHAGLELSKNNLCYKTVIRCTIGNIETQGETLRTSMGIAL